ncbi:MAG: hypothetical protein CMM54_00540 [Rhodospirillaceae bacterium]|jgi:hypothetical protein|nr:hypothetical protein [Rhodospirillaceae bacterium]|tara:strand:+ start:836 stop:1159 length:324 start_codon:yes stop_codon:yes gene_type:complete
MLTPLEALSKLEGSLSSEDKSPLFDCVNRDKSLSVATCLDLFCTVHAKRLTDDPCWKCRQGGTNRLEYAFGLPKTEENIDACMDICASRSPMAKSYYLLKLSNLGAK